METRWKRPGATRRKTRACRTCRNLHDLAHSAATRNPLKPFGHTCHAGGRGFESRRSRSLCSIGSAPSSRFGRAGERHTLDTNDRASRLNRRVFGGIAIGDRDRIPRPRAERGAVRSAAEALRRGCALGRQYQLALPSPRRRKRRWVLQYSGAWRSRVGACRVRKSIRHAARRYSWISPPSRSRR